MKKLLGLLFLFFAFGALAQPESAEVEWKDGKKYYVHFVQQGNTLYGLTKLYKVTADDVIAANPEVTSGLKEGQKLLIPAVSGAGKEPVKNPKDNKAPEKTTTTPAAASGKTHKVEKSETLYGISKKYDVTMEDMVKVNPGIENGISVGQVLNIPEKSKTPVTPAVTTTTPKTPTPPKVTFYDTTIVHTVLDHETMYSISKRFMVPVEELQQFNGLKNTKIKPGETLKIPIKKEKYAKVDVRPVEPVSNKKVDEELIFSKKGDYNIVLLLPFSLDKGKDGLTGLATEFLMGAQIALDSLEELGLKAEVFVLDAGVDSTKLKAMFNQKEFKSADLVIGPFMGNNLTLVANWCKAHKVRMISPISAQTEILKDNPYAYDAVTSDITLMQGMASYIAKNNSKDQVILVKTGAKDQELYQAFRQKFMASTAVSKQKLIEVDLVDLGTHIRKGGNTIFVVPTRDKIQAVKFINALNKVSAKAGTGSISFFGTKDWVNFDDIKGYYKNKYNFHYASSNDFNYSYAETKNLMRQYRRDYNADLSKFGTQGFDVTFYFIQLLLMDDKPQQGVMNNIRLVSTGSGNGQENGACFILRQQDYEIIKVAEVND